MGLELQPHYKVQGAIVVDILVGSPNSSGKSDATDYENGVATKKVFINGMPHPFISGQAFRAWWRDTLQKIIGWEMSPLVRETKVAFTAANPLIYADDDMFGYMRAGKDVEVDEEGKIKTDAKGKEIKTDITVTRTSPLRASALVSVAPTIPTTAWSSMSRAEGDSVPYTKEEYAAWMKGMFSIDLFQVGTFSSFNKSGQKNLSIKLQEEAVKMGAIEFSHPYELSKQGVGHRTLRLPRETRLKRTQDALSALKFLSGGAMQATNLVEVAPKFIILVTSKSGNHPFSHITCSDSEKGMKAALNVPAIVEVLKDHGKYFVGDVFIGKNTGFADEYTSALQDLTNLGDGFPKVHFGSVNQAIDAYNKQLETQII